MLGIKQQQKTRRQVRALACNVMADASVTLTNSNCQLLIKTKISYSQVLH